MVHVVPAAADMYACHAVAFAASFPANLITYQRPNNRGIDIGIYWES